MPQYQCNKIFGRLLLWLSSQVYSNHLTNSHLRAIRLFAFFRQPRKYSQRRDATTQSIYWQKPLRLSFCYLTHNCDLYCNIVSNRSKPYSPIFGGSRLCMFISASSCRTVPFPLSSCT